MVEAFRERSRKRQSVRREEVEEIGWEVKLLQMPTEEKRYISSHYSFSLTYS